MWYLRQSTASQEIPLGPFVDSTDGNTQETALTIASTDIKLFKTGATSEASKNSGGATHIANGRYYAVLDSTDTDTIGPLRVMVHVAGALAVWLDCVVLDEAVYDVLFGTVAPATLSNITSAAGITLADGAITAAKIAADAITAAKIAAGAIDADALATDAVQEIRDAITGGAYALSTDANGRVRIVDGTGAGELDTLSGTVLLRSATQASIDAIEADTNELQTDWTNGGRLDLLIDAILADTDSLDTTKITSARAAVLTDWIDGGRLDLILDARASQASVDTIDDFLDLEVAAILAAVDTEVAAIKAITDQMVFSTANRLNVQVYGMEANTITAAAAAADFGSEIRALVTGGNYALDTDANGRMRIVDGTAAGELDTASGLVKISGTIQTLDALDTAQDAEHDATQAAIAALNNLSAAAVNAEVVDALATDTYAEPGQGSPGATISLAAKINWLYLSWRNKKDNNGTETKLYADNGSTVIAKQTTSESGGTVTKAEWITGA